MENLGQVVFGERLKASPYNITYRSNMTSVFLCKAKHYDLSKRSHRRKLHFLRERIIESYMHTWVIDNMPLTWCYRVLNTNKQFCRTRFPLGCHISKMGLKQEWCYISVSCIYIFSLSHSLSLSLFQSKLNSKGTYIFNHVQFMIWYHGSDNEEGHIVKASVALASCKDKTCNTPLKFPPIRKKAAANTDPFDIQYSYSVVFMVCDTILLLK